MGLPPAKTFSDITPDPTLAATLQQLYGNINNVDAYVGGLAEPHYQQAHVGRLFYLSIKDQFTRLRDGDFWYFENAAANKLFSAAEVDEIKRTSEARVGGWGFVAAGLLGLCTGCLARDLHKLICSARQRWV
jgi:hypothetical protein